MIGIPYFLMIGAIGFLSCVFPNTTDESFSEIDNEFGVLGHIIRLLDFLSIAHIMHYLV